MNKKLMISTIALLSCLFALSNAAYGEKKHLKYPIDCTAGGFRFDHFHVIFDNRARNEQSIYFIHNISNKKVNMLSSIRGEKAYTVHVDGSINAKLWSVLALDEDMKFICTNFNRRKNKHDVIDCSKALEICEFQRSRFGPNTRGNYWVATDRTMGGSVSSARWHGILLTDPKKPKTTYSVKSNEKLKTMEKM